MSKGINAYLIDAETRHQIFIQRFAGGVYKKIDPVISQLKKELLARLAEEGSEIAIIRARVLLADVNDIFTFKKPIMTAILEKQLIQLAKHEVNFQATLLGSTVSVETTRPTIEQVITSITTKKTKLVSGKKIDEMNLEELVSKFVGAKSQQMQNVIASGIIEGKTTPEMIERITTFNDKRVKREAEALVRTATNHCATTARAETMRANADILDGERFIATLDNRTTITCMSFDNQLFPLDEGPIPPMHYGCRSTRIPVIKQSLRVPGFSGERPEKGDDGPNTTSDKTTYNSFLKRQSGAFQVEVLGPERAKLFREGMHVSRFTDSEGRVYSISELKAMDDKFNGGDSLTSFKAQL